MKSVFDEAKSIPKEITFPVLAKFLDSTYGTCVVMFISERTGFCVYSTMKDKPVGYYSKSMYSVYEENKWEILDDASIIVLSNGN